MTKSKEWGKPLYIWLCPPSGPSFSHTFRGLLEYGLERAAGKWVWKAREVLVMNSPIILLGQVIRRAVEDTYDQTS